MLMEGLEQDTVIGSSARRPSVELTYREQEVARLVVRGLSNKQIAGLLSVSLSTAKAHVHAVLTKLGCKNRYELRRFVDVN